jgi:hypothetical protein
MSSYERGQRLEELVDLTVRLTMEFPEFPAGSVMRCVARVVWQQRRLGVPDGLLAGLSEELARQVLTERLTGRLFSAARHPQALSA